MYLHKTLPRMLLPTKRSGSELGKYLPVFKHKIIAPHCQNPAFRAKSYNPISKCLSQIGGQNDLLLPSLTKSH